MVFFSEDDLFHDGCCVSGWSSGAAKHDDRAQCPELCSGNCLSETDQPKRDMETGDVWCAALPAGARDFRSAWWCPVLSGLRAFAAAGGVQPAAHERYVPDVCVRVLSAADHPLRHDRAFLKGHAS